MRARSSSVWKIEPCSSASFQESSGAGQTLKSPPTTAAQPGGWLAARCSASASYQASLRGKSSWPVCLPFGQ